MRLSPRERLTSIKKQLDEVLEEYRAAELNTDWHGYAGEASGALGAALGRGRQPTDIDNTKRRPGDARTEHQRQEDERQDRRARHT